MISVCMATYNGEKYIKEQVESILKQLGEKDELIVSDDNSTDKTLETLKDFNDSRIKILNHQRNFSKSNHASGYYCSNNFSNAIAHATGDYIFLSDQDDIWYDEKVKITLKELKNCDLCLSNLTIINQNGEIIKEKYLFNNPISRSWFYNLNKNIYFGCCMAFKKETLSDFMPIPNSIPSYDSWIGAILHLNGKEIHYIEEPLIYYRRHNNNVSNATSSSNNPLWFKLYWRIQFILTLLKKQKLVYNNKSS